MRIRQGTVPHFLLIQEAAAKACVVFGHLHQVYYFHHLCHQRQLQLKRHPLKSSLVLIYSFATWHYLRNFYLNPLKVSKTVRLLSRLNASECYRQILMWVGPWQAKLIKHQQKGLVSYPALVVICIFNDGNGQNLGYRFRRFTIMRTSVDGREASGHIHTWLYSWVIKECMHTRTTP